MNRPANIQAATYAWRTVDCTECGGEGVILESCRWAGEAYGEWVEAHCAECDGAGEVDASCAECDVIRPLNADGICSGCASELVEVEYLKSGVML